jgi:hypothetical protein
MFPARAAREKAGLTSQAAARRLGISARHLLECERSGKWGFGTAEVAARLYGCGLEVFLPFAGCWRRQRDLLPGARRRQCRKPGRGSAAPARRGGR